MRRCKFTVEWDIQLNLQWKEPIETLELTEFLKVRMIHEQWCAGKECRHISYFPTGIAERLTIKIFEQKRANLFGCSLLPLGSTSPEPCLGGSQGAGFGWDDMTTYKVGVEWATDSNNVWRFGYSYGEQPVQEIDVLFNILAPGVMEQHITFGWTRTRDNGHQFAMSLMYAPENEVTGPSLFDPLQTVTLSMSQFEFEFAYRWGSGR